MESTDRILAVDLVGVISRWLEERTPNSANAPSRFLICVGLVLLERFHENWPLTESQISTKKGEFKTSGPQVQRILARYGVNQSFARAGGRTTAGTLPAAIDLLSSLNGLSAFPTLTGLQRSAAIAQAQGWLAKKATEIMETTMTPVYLSPDLSTRENFRRLLSAGTTPRSYNALLRNMAEAVLLVTISHPDARINAGLDDGSLDRFFGLVFGDTVIVISVKPNRSEFHEIQNWISDGCRLYLLVPEPHFKTAMDLAAEAKTSQVLQVSSAESFLAQVVDIHSRFTKVSWQQTMSSILNQYRYITETRRVPSPVLFRVEFVSAERRPETAQ